MVTVGVESNGRELRRPWCVDIVTPTDVDESGQPAVGSAGVSAARTGADTIAAMTPKPPSEPTWTSRKLLEWTTDHFERRGVDPARLAAEMLLAHVLDSPRIRLYTDLDRPASPLERAAYRELVERAAAHEPVQYLVGEAYFFSMSFEVNPDVLIPRPSTEALVEHVVQHAKRTPGFHEPTIADIGTGSGCIAVAVAKHLAEARVVATDVSDAALAVARRNAERHGVADRIDFRPGGLFEPLSGRYAFICANPPYIPDDEWGAVAANVKRYEPTGALRGGPEGMDVVGPLIDGAGRWLADPGQLVVEFAASRKAMVLERARGAKGLAHAHVLADAEGHPRVLVADRA